MSIDQAPSAQPQVAKQKIADILAANLLWYALSVVVTTVVATMGAFLFLEGRIDRETQLLVPVKVTEVMNSQFTALIEREVGLLVPNKVTEVVNNQTAAWTAERRTAENEARDAQDRARRQEIQAQGAFADAQGLAGKAKQLETEFTMKIEQATTAFDLSRVTSRIDAQLADPSFRQLVISRVLPSGAVMAFDLSTGCPDGWSRFDRAGGRTLVGAGPHGNLDTSGRPLSNYNFGQVGGSEGFVLGKDDIPPQNVTISDNQSNLFLWLNYAGRNADNTQPLLGYSRAQVGPLVGPLTAKTDGRGLEHKYSPPYLAINFCRKSD